MAPTYTMRSRDDGPGAAAVISDVCGSASRRAVTWWPAALAAAFVFRLLFGLSSDFFFEDQTQIFLIGFRYFATGDWPYFGPDVVWTKSEIPGALQGLLVGIPLRIAAVPESPFVLLNLISMAALSAFAWYLSAGFPRSPRWLLWGWLLTIPWTIQFSTTIINTSYILPASLVFFIGFFESVAVFRAGVVSRPTAHLLMGAALGWLIQIHMSWPLLVPFAAIAWLSGRGGVRGLAIDALAFAGGLAIFGVLLVPTWLRYGLEAGDGGTLRNVHVHGVNPWVMVTTLARFLSFASLEVNRFIAIDGAKRIAFFERHLWLAPLGALVWAAGTIQPVWMLVDGVRRRSGPSWNAIRWLAGGCVVLVYASYGFVIEPPQAHAFYVLSPVAFMFAAYWWSFLDSPRARRVAAAVLAINIAFHAGLAWAQAPEQSLYRNREPVAAAVALRQPEMFAHRRPFALGGGPLSLQDPTRPYEPVRDLTIEVHGWEVGFRGSTDWRITLRNTNPRVAFRDLRYITTYVNASGTVVEQRYEVIKDIFEPGAVRPLTVNDGFVRTPFASATFRITAADALVPAPQSQYNP
jgi:hypothetical protein